MVKYKLTEDADRFVLTATGMNFHINSRHGKEYQEWIAQGNIPIPADVPDPMIAIRAERDRLLAITDKEINNAWDKNLPTLSALKLRRTALKDVPQNFPNADMATFDWSTI